VGRSETLRRAKVKNANDIAIQIQQSMVAYLLNVVMRGGDHVSQLLMVQESTIVGMIRVGHLPEQSLQILQLGALPSVQRSKREH